MRWIPILAGAALVALGLAGSARAGRQEEQPDLARQVARLADETKALRALVIEQGARIDKLQDDLARAARALAEQGVDAGVSGGPFAALEAALAEQKDRIERLEQQMGGVASWFRAMTEAVATFAAGVEDTQAKGFTYAGTNIDARVALLNALRSLGRGLVSGDPFRPAEK